MAGEEDKLPSIRDRLEEAWNEAENAPEEREEPAAPPPRRPRPEPDDDGPDELAEGIEKRPRTAEERPRDDKGRFIKDGEEAPEEAPKPPEARPEREQPKEPPAAEEDEEREASKPLDREQRLAQLTKNWRPEQREFLSQQAPEVQDFLIERDREMTTAYTRKTQGLAGFINEYGPVHQMLEPELPAIQAAGYTPRLLIEGWANCERALLQGPEQAARTLRTIAEGYKVPRETIAAIFGFDPRTPDQILGGQPAPAGGFAPPSPANGAGNGHDVPFRDPRVDMILAERQQQEERAQIAYNQQLRHAANNAMTQINQFREERDTKGNLKHPYFAEVEDHMTALAQFYGQRDGRIPPLKQLYDDAVNANPATRARLLAATHAAQSERQRTTEAARGKAEQARRAATSVVGSGRPTNRTPGPPPKGQSIRASIDAAYESVVGEE